ncbi:hypothetical protein ACHAXM_000716 [Skeletonema potamos]
MAVPILLSVLNNNIQSANRFQSVFSLSRESVFSLSRESVLENLPRASVHRIAFITFSYIKQNDTNKLFNFLLPAVDTWAAPTPSPSSEHDLNTTLNVNKNNPNEFNNVDHPREVPLYVVFSNTSREAFEDTCLQSDKLTPHQRMLCSRIHPIYVDCPEGKFGESPCCKQQNGLVEIFDKKYPLYDWYAFFDDDVYLRKEYVARLLAELRPPDFPMAAAPYNKEARAIGFGRKLCGTDRKEFLYPWGQPIFYSRGAIKMMERGYRANSLVSQCAAFELTHDVGNQVLNWMYSLPIAMLPPLPELPHMRGDFIGSHWVGREDMRAHMQLRSKAMTSTSVGSWSFHETHKKWMEFDPPKVETVVTVKDETMKWYKNVTGFHQTLTYELHGDPQTWEEGYWYTMQYSDCMHTINNTAHV